MANNAAYYHWWKNYWTARSAGGWTPARLASDARTLLSEWNVQGDGIVNDSGVSILDDSLATNKKAARSFNGTSDYIDTGVAFSPSGDYEISGWFKLGATAAAQIIYDARDLGSDGAIITIASTTSVLRFVHNATTLDSVSAYDDDVWHRFVASKSGSTLSLKVYDIDGTLAEAEITDTDASAIDVTALAKIGVRSHTSLLSFFNGQLANIKATDGSTTIIDMNDDSGFTYNGTIAYTASINGNNFTQPTTSAQPTLSGTGTDTVITFDGTGDYLSQPVTADNFQNLTRFTWAGVIYCESGKVSTSFSFSDASSNLDYLLLQIDGLKNLRILSVNASVSKQMYVNEALDDGYHVVILEMNGTTYTPYIDGVQKTFTVNSGVNDGLMIGDYTNKLNYDVLSIASLSRPSVIYYPNKEKLQLCFGGTTDAALSTAAERTNIFNYINQTAGLGL